MIRLIFFLVVLIVAMVVTYSVIEYREVKPSTK